MSRYYNSLSIDNPRFDALQERLMQQSWEQWECEIVLHQLIKGDTVLEEKEMTRAEAEGRNKTFNQKGLLGRWEEKVEAYGRPANDISDLPF